MATQAKKEKAMLRQAVPAVTAPAEEVVPPTQAAEAAEVPAQYKPGLGDRILYVICFLGAGLLALHVVVDTIVGLFF